MNVPEFIFSLKMVPETINVSLRRNVGTHDIILFPKTKEKFNLNACCQYHKNIVICHLMMGMLSEKCTFRQF
jgi:hypothetical protein